MELPIVGIVPLHIPINLTIGNTRVSVAYYSFYDNIQLYEPLGKACANIELCQIIICCIYVVLSCY